jgi:hypothetical protein
LPVHFIFLTPLPGLLAAELPDDAALAELAVEAGVPVRVMAAFIHVFHGEIIAKVLMVDQASGKFKIQDTKPKPAQAGSLCHLEKNVGWELPTINLSTEQTTLMMVN